MQAISDVLSIDDHRPEFNDGEQAEHLSGYDLHVFGQVLRLEERVYDVRNEQKTHEAEHYACLEVSLDLVGGGVAAVERPNTDGS